MPTPTDVVIVGGGIAGAALAYALAGEDVGVTVLEASTEFPDRVRGESMQAWGVAEARTLGVEDVLLAAGAHIASVWNQYDEDVSGPMPIPMSIMVPGVEGTLNLRHPDACQALLDAAAFAGATVVRGVSKIDLAQGSPWTVGYENDGDRGELSTPLVVGADGRNSTVRKQIGITLERQEPISYISGLLVDGLDGVPDDFDALSSEGENWFLVFHQRDGRARLYSCTGLSGQHRFAGPEGTQKFLDAAAQSSFPWREQVSSATPAGPCATYPGDDTWTAQPCVEGAVLIGDAAGHNDPIVGQGLSIAMRDARTVRDLVLDGARDVAGFASYSAERMERMRRLRLIADAIGVIQVEDAGNRKARRAFFGEKMAAMDPAYFPLLIGGFTGPETIPDEVVDESVLDRIREA